MFRSTTIIRELQCPCQSHYYLNHSCMYTTRGGVAAYRIVWIGLCLRIVSGVSVLASGVDDESSTALARTRTPGTLLMHKPIQTT
jgi:hypothetical protein